MKKLTLRELAAIDMLPASLPLHSGELQKVLPFVSPQSGVVDLLEAYQMLADSVNVNCFIVATPKLVPASLPLHSGE